MITVLIVLQAVEVVILWGHDWIPLGRLNDIAAVRTSDTAKRLARVTLVQGVPFSAGLVATILFARTGHPRFVWPWLWISYAILFAGELRAWWWPYLTRVVPERAARYQAMFGRTVAFLPERNGMVPNALHVVLHTSTVATVITLAVRWIAPSQPIMVCAASERLE